MIIQELRAEFNEYFASPNAELIMWLDPSTQWNGVIKHLKTDFRVVEFKGSQLEVKAEVELTRKKGDIPKFVLYLPGLTRNDLTVLKEYEFSGKVFEETILQAFRRWGIDFEREHEDELEKILPISVTQYATKSKAFWPNPLTPENVRTLLFDDEDVRIMLAAPEATTKELTTRGSYEKFCDFVENQFGGPKLRDTEPKEWARLFTAYLMLTEVRSGAGHPLSFPQFAVSYAEDRHEGKCHSFIRDWLRNGTYKEDFKRLSQDIEEIYDLSSWAASLSEYPNSESSLSIEKTMENRILAQINNAKTVDECRNVLSGAVDVIEQMAEHFWSREGDIVAWRALQLGSNLVTAIDNGIAEIKEIDSSSSLVKKYAEVWWKIDKNYRSYRATYDGENRLSKLSMLITAIYRRFQNQLNETFSSLVEGAGSLQIEGIEKQSTFWANRVSQSKKKRAVFLVDALRFELALDLKERLKETFRDAQVTCTPLAANAPTLTPIGMATIVSGEDIKVNLTADGNWNVRSIGKGKSETLSAKAGRKAFLKRKHQKAAFYDLEDILKPAELNIGDGNPVVVFTQAMDGTGHDSGVLNLSIDYFGKYLDLLTRAIKRLTSMGIVEIHIVSDHGFILLDEITDADKVTIPNELELLYKGHRCIVGKDLPESLGVVLELHNSDKLQFCVPRGTGIFRARGEHHFLHGGISIQELIIPHVEILARKAPPKYGVTLNAPEAIYNLIFEVELLRAMPSAGVLVGEPRFLEIVGTFIRDDEEIEIIQQSGPDLVINQEKEKLDVRLRIKPGTPFRYGDVLHLKLRDADTPGKLLDTADIRIEVESE